MQRRASALSPFDFHMLRLGCNSPVVRETGPALAGELEVGDKVLGMIRGVPAYAPVIEVGKIKPERASRIFTDAGDLLLGLDTKVVTLNGPFAAEELAMMREQRAFGRMSGSWPLLEVLSSPVPPIDKSLPSAQRAFVNDCRSRLVTLAGQGLAGVSCIRIGCHAKAALDEFALHALGRDYVVEPGSAGWAWLRQGHRQELAIPEVGGTKFVVSCLLALWQTLGELGVYRLPLEFEALRGYTLGALAYTGVLFDTDYRPRYLPLQVGLSLSPSARAHAEVQGTYMVEGAEVVDIRLGVGGCYLVAGALLCGQ